LVAVCAIQFMRRNRATPHGCTDEIQQYVVSAGLKGSHFRRFQVSQIAG
jgi:hypothetical protein